MVCEILPSFGDKTVSNTIQKVAYDKETISKLMDKLATTIENSQYQFDYIIGIENGGLHISKPLAKRFNKLHASIKISFYGGGTEKHKDPIVDLKGIVFYPDRSYLFVDDLVDSGSTFDYLAKALPAGTNYKTAVLFWKKHNEYDVVPNFYAAKKPDAWIEFPWGD